MEIYSTPTKPTTPPKIKVAISNYHRDPEGPASVSGDGREFVMIKEDADAALGGIPTKGNRMEDPEFGKMTISSVKELPGLGGQIIGYRVRVE